MNAADQHRHLLPDGVDVKFADIQSAMSAAGGSRKGHVPPRASIATIVAIGPAEQLQGPAEALEQLGESGVRAILIAEGSESRPSVRVSAHAIAILGLKSQFLDNAVAALRLSSLPTLVWWLGGSPNALERVAHLADRLVLDLPDPSDVWARVPALAQQTAVSDLRWTRLTRWRALMAHFFDVPEVAAAAFHLLEVAGSDRFAAKLFAGWIRSSLRRADSLRIELHDAADGAPLRSVRMTDGIQELALKLVPAHTCVEAAAHIQGLGDVSRTVSLGDQSPGALMAEELRIRARDAAFERAISGL